MIDSKRASVLTSGPLWSSCGRQRDTIRHYESSGSARSQCGPRKGTVSIPAALCSAFKPFERSQSGIRLTEPPELSRERDTGGAPCQRFASMASEKSGAHKQIAELTEDATGFPPRLRNEQRFERTPSGKRAGPLESLALQYLSTNRQKKGKNPEINFSVSVLGLSLAESAQTHTGCPMHDQQGTSDQHAAGVDTRGDHAMATPQATAHHFTLLSDGGIIEVDIKADHDDATRTQIRTHLAHIAAMFSSNDFDVPMFNHHTRLPGVPTMKVKHDPSPTLSGPRSGRTGTDDHTRSRSVQGGALTFGNFRFLITGAAIRMKRSNAGHPRSPNARDRGHPPFVAGEGREKQKQVPVCTPIACAIFAQGRLSAPLKSASLGMTHQWVG